jgi:hypothetical protein
MFWASTAMRSGRLMISRAGLIVQQLPRPPEVAHAEVDAYGAARPAADLARVAALATTDIEYEVARPDGQVSVEIDADGIVRRGYFLRSAIARS